MIVYDKKWTLKYHKALEEDELTKKLNISRVMTQVIKNRGIEKLEEAVSFINPSLEYLHDPFLLKDMDKATLRIKNAIENKESIWIYGDYDVDGVSSTSLLLLYFRSIGYKVNYYIPNRLEEGYGINKEAVDYIKSNGADLIISVDCGITSVEEVEYINDLGMDIIITDHHECKEEIPKAIAIINPKQEDCTYPFKALCGCGVALKLIQGLTPKEEFKNNIYNYLEIVTLATICDIVPLVGENRILVKNGLKVMEDSINLGIKSLIKICGLDEKKISSSHIGFALGPRINAAGRMGYSDLGVKLFTEEDEINALEIAKLLEEKNIERQLVESRMYKEAEEIMLSDKKYEKEKVLVIASSNWHHGIIGIVASKITEKYYKPTILLAIEEGEGKGSARSIEGFNMFEGLLTCQDILSKFGGHEQAAGLSVAENKIPLLRERINQCADFNLTKEDMIENIQVELELPQEAIHFPLIDELHHLEPFGMGNPSPKFLMREVEIAEIRTVGREKEHLKLSIRKKKNYDCIGFYMGHYTSKLKKGDKIDLVFSLEINEYMGNKKIQFLLKDIRLFYPQNIMMQDAFVQALKCMNPSILKYKENSVQIISKEKVNVLEKIKDKTLILANSIERGAKAISDISLLDIEYTFCYNEEQNNKASAVIILFPYIDKINLKRYNNIILYDFLYTREEYTFLYENVDENTRIIKYYEEKEMVYLNQFVENLIPSREELINIYKFLRQHTDLNVELKYIESFFHVNMHKVLSGLKIFKDVSLLDYEIDDTLKIKLLPSPKEKADLNTSETLKDLKLFKERFVKMRENIGGIKNGFKV